jgi:hypothetical protein
MDFQEDACVQRQAEVQGNTFYRCVNQFAAPSSAFESEHQLSTTRKEYLSNV